MIRLVLVAALAFLAGRASSVEAAPMPPNLGTLPVRPSLDFTTTRVQRALGLAQRRHILLRGCHR